MQILVTLETVGAKETASAAGLGLEVQQFVPAIHQISP